MICETFLFEESKTTAVSAGTEPGLRVHPVRAVRDNIRVRVAGLIQAEELEKEAA
jgi:hypothetical protein